MNAAILATTDPLVCRCGSENLHQVAVVVHNRATEDAASESIVVRQHGSTDDAPSPPYHPSNRRQGLSVAMRCEACPAITWLHVYQDKGSTFLRLDEGRDLWGREETIARARRDAAERKSRPL